MTRTYIAAPRSFIDGSDDHWRVADLRGLTIHEPETPAHNTGLLNHRGAPIFVTSRAPMGFVPR